MWPSATTGSCWPPTARSTAAPPRFCGRCTPPNSAQPPPSFPPELQFVVTHRVEAIRGDPDLALVLARHAGLELSGFLDGYQLNERLAIAGDNYLFPGKGTLDQARE